MKKVPYSYQNVTIFKQISRNTLKKAFKEIGGTPKIKSGPPQEELTPELILKVQNSYENYKCGVQKLYWTLNMNPKQFQISYNAVIKAAKFLGIYKEKDKSNPKAYYVDYEAILPNTIWHVDIHFLKEPETLPVYGIIDDKSRYLLALKLLRNKSSTETSKVAIATVQKYGAPFCFWSDNGKENEGEFTKFLSTYDIQIRKSAPYMPRQNGKIERLWPSLDKNAPKSSEFESINQELEEFRQKYNDMPHGAHPKIGVRPYTPREVYNKFKKWTKDDEPLWKKCVNKQWEVEEIPNY